MAAGLDFLVLTEHVPANAIGRLPGAERAGLHARGSRRLLVLVGGEFGTRDGHVLGLGLVEAVRADEHTPAAEVIERIDRAGGFAVIPHPFAYGGFHGWDADFRGLEVHNNAAAFRSALGPLLPFRLLRFAFDRDGVARGLLARPDRALEKLDALWSEGRRVIAFSGADAHQNVGLTGFSLDPYAWVFGLVRTHCPDGPLEATSILAKLHDGQCWIRYAVHEQDAARAVRRELPSGRVELWLDRGRRVLEIRNPPKRDAPLSSER